MERSQFYENLIAASKRCVAFTQSMVINDLPGQFLYLVLPNASFDGHPLIRDEELFPNDSFKPGRLPTPRDSEGAVEYLWRGGKVPEWIDVIICRVAGGYTFINLLCCGRFTANDELLYYRDGYPPFGIKGTALPPGWESVGESGRFDLDWREKKH
jgi:hypothetical protein